MADYLQMNTSTLYAIYMLTGFLESGQFFIKLAHSDQLEQAKLHFKFEPQCVIYSLHRQRCQVGLINKLMFLF